MLTPAEIKKGKYHNYKIYFLWTIALALAVYFFFFVFKNANRQSQGFATYYTASKLLSEGVDVSQFYDNDWFSIKVKNMYLMFMKSITLILQQLHFCFYRFRI
ncbi:MAG: hypothetical protein KJN64_09960 [Ignavibacteria bacterium]|nr:hypothetical protein [Ignavibacteria bacterium]MBT8392964.1 hypothetical protein [Ignavibacteria bacterium]NNJ53881.1 hypothetical protein [Ignavibacteriaceae bacterium]NNL19751.1 hypothetical protein [Ignavibacteriaceae bacterium]